MNDTLTLPFDGSPRADAANGTPSDEDHGLTATPRPQFPRLPGETPRAFGAFRVFFTLGHGRSLAAAAEQLGEKLGTVKTWSAKFHWSQRIQSFDSGLLEQQAVAEAAVRRQHAADWARRTQEYREQEWEAAQKLLGAAQCFLESFGEREVERMTLAQVARALHIASRIARQALSGGLTDEGPALAPLQAELAAALNKAYALPAETTHPPDPPGGDRFHSVPIDAGNIKDGVESAPANFPGRAG